MPFFSKPANVFISYSSMDRDLILPIVKLVSVSNQGSVFQDVNDVLPGDIWERKIVKAIRRCKMMFVFWCKHSEASSWVHKEWTLAVEAKKRIVPILLDDTPLPHPL